MNYGRRPRGQVFVLLFVTTVFEGLRAGAGTFRALIDLPARHRIGPTAFADFSRATDLSTAGMVFYALFGFGGVLLTAVTWVFAVRGHAPRAVSRLTAVAALSSVTILVLTSQAAPLMWRVGRSADDPVLLAGLLDRFVLWTDLRIICADVSFLAVLTALAIWTHSDRPSAGLSPR